MQINFTQNYSILNDLFGKALADYYHNPEKQEIITWTNLTEEDPVPLSYFFRDYAGMPKLEQKAIELSRGKTLDIGCGSGSHSLYIQNKRNIDVTGLDVSSGAISVAKSRGVDKTVCTSIMDYSAEKFDTLLLLMNGLGIAMTLKGVYPLLIHLKSLMNPKAQILLDSSNLIYLFDEEDQENWLNDERYYGEVDYGISYKGSTEEFPWLYLDYENLNELAPLAGFDCKKIMDGENEDYLACLTSMES